MSFFYLIIFLFQIILCEPFDGLTLITGMSGGENSSQTHLIDNDENIINYWSHPASSASVGYLTKDSILYLPTRSGGGNGGPAGGLFQKIDWYGNIIWEWAMPTEICNPHHDITILPNGNILAICEEYKSNQELLDAGLEGAIGLMKIDMIVEIQPMPNNNAEIVWKWHFWDHLVQDRNPNYTATYGEISNHPELLDINVNGNEANDVYDWNHTNKISYNEKFDQIVISCRHMNEIYVIDHSTTTEEAAGHSGGNYGMGGDILYRWGNPQNYGRGDISDKIFGAQHGILWIPDGYPGEGNFLIYNNIHQTNPNRSAVLEFENIADENGFYTIGENEPFGPETYSWIYLADFFSPTQSGAYRLPNGNTLITVTMEYNFFEVDNTGRVQWDPSFNSQCARALKYGYDYFEDSIKGDINGDQGLNILDIILMINYILQNQYNIDIDMNQDSEINILDIIELINLIL
mgnify:FL=1